MGSALDVAVKHIHVVQLRQPLAHVQQNGRLLQVDLINRAPEARPVVVVLQEVFQRDRAPLGDDGVDDLPAVRAVSPLFQDTVARDDVRVVQVKEELHLGRQVASPLALLRTRTFQICMRK